MQQLSFFDWLDDQPSAPEGVLRTGPNGETRVLPARAVFEREYRSTRPRRWTTAEISLRLDEMAARSRAQDRKLEELGLL
jgi:hypothetical protein